MLLFVAKRLLLIASERESVRDVVFLATIILASAFAVACSPPNEHETGPQARYIGLPLTVIAVPSTFYIIQRRVKDGKAMSGSQIIVDVIGVILIYPVWAYVWGYIQLVLRWYWI